MFQIEVSFETPHGIWLLSYEPLPLFQLFKLKSAIEIYDGMNLLRNESHSGKIWGAC